MLDIRVIREDPEKIRNALLKRLDTLSFDELLQWDAQRRQTIQDAEALKNKRNVVSAKIPVLMKEAPHEVEPTKAEMSLIGKRIAELDNEQRIIEEKIEDFMSQLPNLPDEDVPAGGKENNIVLEVNGEKPQFSFEPKSHIDLCRDLDLIDYERGVKLSGAGHWIYKGFGARLEWALINFFVREHIADGYEFVFLPYMLNYECGYVAGQFPKFVEEDYWIDGGPDKAGRFLLPTAETALVNIHRDEIFTEADLPKKYFSYTQCFRREAGSSRIEERGMIRGHQFNKVEMVQYVHPDNSEKAFMELADKAKSLVTKLGLHFRMSQLAAKDCGYAMARTYDVEIWIPSMEIYKEVSSASNSYEYQARRGKTRYRNTNGKLDFVHILNASGLATSRVFPAILEQNQREDGSVVVPEVLRNDVGTDILRPI